VASGRDKSTRVRENPHSDSKTSTTAYGLRFRARLQTRPAPRASRLVPLFSLPPPLPVSLLLPLLPAGLTPCNLCRCKTEERYLLRSWRETKTPFSLFPSFADGFLQLFPGFLPGFFAPAWRSSQRSASAAKIAQNGIHCRQAAVCRSHWKQ